MDVNHEEEIRRKRDEVYAAVTMFEAAKRKVYRHCRYPMPAEITRSLGGTSTRADGALFVRLEGNCRDCGGQHTLIGRKQYLEWYSKLPYLCEHRQVIEGMEVELDVGVARATRQIFMPSELVRADPGGMSESSVGQVDRFKLNNDRERITRFAEESIRQLREAVAFVRNVKPNMNRFPELQVNHLHDLIAGVLAQQEDALSVVDRLLEGMERIDLELEDEYEQTRPNLAGLLESGEDMFEDGYQFQLQGRPRDPLDFSLGYVLNEFFNEQAEREEVIEELQDNDATPTRSTSNDRDIRGQEILQVKDKKGIATDRRIARETNSPQGQ